MDAFLSAWILGLSIALPFGPVSLMCLEHSLSQGFLRGLVSGAGAATTHGIYATLAVIGANSAAAPLIGHQALIHTLSGLVFVFIGIRTLLRVRMPGQSIETRAGSFSIYLGGIGLALANPMTILPYVAFAGTAVLSGPERNAAQVASIIGIGLGTLSWYWTMSSSAWLFRQRLPTGLLQRLNLVSGIILIAMGLLMVLRL